jgi:hypothetical protein
VCVCYLSKKNSNTFPYIEKVRLFLYSQIDRKRERERERERNRMTMTQLLRYKKRTRSQESLIEKRKPL